VPAGASAQNYLAELLSRPESPFRSLLSSTPVQLLRSGPSGYAGDAGLTPTVTADLVHYRSTTATPLPEGGLYSALPSGSLGSPSQTLGVENYMIQSAEQDSEVKTFLWTHSAQMATPLAALGHYPRLPSPQQELNVEKESLHFLQQPPLESEVLVIPFLPSPEPERKPNVENKNALSLQEPLLESEALVIPFLPSPEPERKPMEPKAEAETPPIENTLRVWSVPVATPKYEGPDADQKLFISPPPSKNVRASTLEPPGSELQTRVRGVSFPLPVRSPPPQERRDSEEFATPPRAERGPVDWDRASHARNRGETAPLATDYLPQFPEAEESASSRGQLISPKLLFLHKPPSKQ
jgi:hypothetical protein